MKPTSLKNDISRDSLDSENIALESNPDSLVRELESLRAENEALKANRGFGLIWEEQPEEQIERELATKIPVFKQIESLNVEGAIPDLDNPHILIEGDNLHALTVLQATHKGKIDVIYIDPPYNTGKEFIYNDKLVTKEDSFRHSAWLSFMNKRLRIARNLLSDSGVIFVSIDDNEQAHLKMLLDNIFVENNLVCNFIWRRSGAGGLRGVFPVTTHEYILAYGKDKAKIRDSWFAPYSQAAKDAFRHVDEFGEYKTQALYLTSLKSTKSQSYFIELPDKTYARPPVEHGSWRYIESTYLKELAKCNIVFKKVKNSPLLLKNGAKAAYNIYTKQYKSIEGSNPTSILPEETVGQTRAGRAELSNIFNENVFDYAKPSNLIKYLITLSTSKNKNAIILDFFAGSGTTAHSVVSLNLEDGGSRQAIIVTNNENNICRDVTQLRVKAVLNGKWADGRQHESLPGSLKFYETTFISRDSSTDITRIRVADEIAGVLAVKENTHNIRIDGDVALLTNSKKTVIAWTNLLDTKGLLPYLNAYKKRKDKATETVVYVGSWAVLGDADMLALQDKFPGWRFETLPDLFIQELSKAQTISKRPGKGSQKK